MTELALPSVQLDAVVDLLAKYNECKRAIKYWTNELDAVKEQLAAKLGDAEEGTVEGRPVYFYNRVDRVNVTALKKEHPDIYRVYEHEVTKVTFDVDLFKHARPDLYARYQVRQARNDFSG